MRKFPPVEVLVFCAMRNLISALSAPCIVPLSSPLASRDTELTIVVLSSPDPSEPTVPVAAKPEVAFTPQMDEQILRGMVEQLVR